jgi:hypothetical protein
MASSSRKLLFFGLFPLLGVCLAFFLQGGCGDISGEISSVTINPETVSVGVSKSYLFTALGKDSVGKIVDVTITWSVEGGIGEVLPSGLFKAGGTEGTGSVVASAGSFSDSATVTITAKGWLTGRVQAIDAGYLPGIKVSLKDHPLFTEYTNTSGSYTIASIPAGTYLAYTDETTNYYSASSEVTIASGETVTWSPLLTLKPGVPTIPTTTLPIF